MGGFLQKLQKLIACVQSVTVRESFYFRFQFVTLALKTIIQTKLNNPFDMKMTSAMKNSEKICKLEYWEPTSHQDPDEQNKVNEANEIEDESV